MDDAPIARKHTDFAKMKADEYRYWQSRPVHERLDAVEKMIEATYALKGWKIEPDVPRLQNLLSALLKFGSVMLPFGYEPARKAI